MRTRLLRTPLTASSTKLRFFTLIACGSVASFAVGSDAFAAPPPPPIPGASSPLLVDQPPNVLLLLDTSGSMERNTDGTLPTCAPGGTPVPLAGCQLATPNRWGQVVQALTGTITPGYYAAALDRSSTQFQNLYTIGGKKPYDTGYALAHYVPLAGDGSAPAPLCAMLPYKLPGGTGGNGVGLGASFETGSKADDFPGDAIEGGLWTTAAANSWSPNNGSNAATDPNVCTFSQTSDGELDLMDQYARFAIMTFDSDPDTATPVGVGPLGTGLQPLGVPEIGVTQLAGGFALGPGLNPFVGQWSYVDNKPAGCEESQLPACSLLNFEVGSRDEAAPPWEGRLVPFSNPLGTQTDMDATNSQIQSVITSVRPYGATPMLGMFRDAMDYMTVAHGGGNTPSSHIGPQDNDPYSQGGCRDQYIVLLTDGAPNLDMRPQCGGPGGLCPFDSNPSSLTAMQNVVEALSLGTSTTYDGAAVGGISHIVRSYVIGFSVSASPGAPANDDGVPVINGTPAAAACTAANNCTCSDWFSDTSGNGGQSNGQTMVNKCIANPPASGTTGEACCILNTIAYYGSNDGTGVHDPNAHAYFAENQQDLTAAFGAIFGNIAKTVTSRTTPSYSATTAIAGGTMSASFTASFSPSFSAPWSGDIVRSRQVCDPTSGATTTIGFTAGDVDDFASDLAVGGTRYFITAKPDAAPGGTPGNQYDAEASLRPYLTSTGTTAADGTTGYQAQEQLVLSTTAPLSVATTIDPDTFNVGATTCGKSKDPKTNAIIPALDAVHCSAVMWGFATAVQGPLVYSGYDFSKRCPIPGNTLTCDALGPIFHASPAPVPPPGSLNRDDAYRLFAAATSPPPTAFGQRLPILYAATTDGLVHAFDYSVGGSTPAPPAQDNEQWAFVPPAAISTLQSNYPTGQATIIDGTPVVKDAVWDRKQADILAPNAQKWHTMLVAGTGAPPTSSGYYALDVSDPVTPATVYNQPSEGVYPALDTYIHTKRGPHFMWQLTTVDAKSGGLGHGHKKKKKGKDGLDQYQLFGDVTGTPAITTLFFDPGDGNGTREIGVAVLPGGAPSTGAVAGATCLRGTGNNLSGANGLGNYTNATTFQDLSPVAYPSRTRVRQWGQTSCADAVQGRSLTIVRLDTGQIVRVFGRQQQDIPDLLASKPAPFVVTDTALDSPITGTPLVYPADVGADAQKIFVGDADGTIWRFDVSNTDPNKWAGAIFFDTANSAVDHNATPGLDGEPINIPVVGALDSSGRLVVIAATGDQDSITDQKPLGGNAVEPFNFVYSLTELATGIPATPVASSVNWYLPLTQGERVTGPMAVFDRTAYFATYQPAPVTNVCAAGVSRLWGRDYLLPHDPANLNLGGEYRYPIAAPAPFDVPFPVGNANAGQLIPGVSIQATLACADTAGTTTDYFGTHNTATNITPTQYSLFVNVANKSASGGLASYGGLGTPTASLQLPNTQTIIDSWVAVVE